MATPHVAGAAALYLEQHTDKTPAQVRDALVAAATPNVVVNPGAGSPNRLLYAALVEFTTPQVTVQRPNGGETVFSGAPYAIEWDASDIDGLAGFDVLLSTDGGVNYTPLAGCTDLGGAERTCTWAQPNPVTSKARIRVVARDTLGSTAFDQSDANVTVAAGVATVKVTTPNTALNWGRGSTRQIKWTHNLGATSYMRVELSRDGGASFPEVLASSIKNSSSSSGSLIWQVSGPNVSTAIVRVSWTNGPASDTGDVAFTIAEPYIRLSGPAAASNWGYDTTRRVSWETNLGAQDSVNVNLSTDGGVTYPVTLRTEVKAAGASADVLTPVFATPISSARIRVAWTNAPAGLAAAGVNPMNFQIAPPYVTITAPNGGQTWTTGLATSIRWTSNLGARENVRIELSADGGATYGTVLLPTTPSDGSQSVTVKGAWVSQTAKIRIAWLKDGAMTDASNAIFRIQ